VLFAQPGFEVNQSFEWFVLVSLVFGLSGF
jgi:hypothetical protein